MLVTLLYPITQYIFLTSLFSDFKPMYSNYASSIHRISSEILFPPIHTNNDSDGNGPKIDKY